jgi:hypothetical protein
MLPANPSGIPQPWGFRKHPPVRDLAGRYGVPRLNAMQATAYLVGAGLVLVAIAVAVTVLRARSAA